MKRARLYNQVYYSRVNLSLEKSESLTLNSKPDYFMFWRKILSFSFKVVDKCFTSVFYKGTDSKYFRLS